MKIEEDISGIIAGQDKHPELRNPRRKATVIGVTLLSEQRNLQPASIYPGEQMSRNNEVNRAMSARSGILATLKTHKTLSKEMESLLSGL